MKPSKSWLWGLLLLGDVRKILTEDTNSVVDAFTANTTGTELNCYDNLDRLAEDVENRDESTLFEMKEYVLCPNTVFNIGAPRDTLDNVGGQEALRLRKNSRFLCGADGKSSNNCILLGGLFQVVSWSHTFGEPTKENVEVVGLTFRDAEASAVLLVTVGDVLFTDCLFDNQRNAGIVQLLFISDTDKNRRLKEVGHEEHQDEDKTTRALTNYYYDIVSNPENKRAYREMAKRSLQDSPEREVFTAEFDDCLFQFNSYGTENAATTHHGVINVESPSNRLVVRNSIFYENSFGDEGITPTTSTIDVYEGAELIVEGNCFLNNDLIGRGAVLLETADQLLSAQNNFGTFDAGLKCQFIHIDGGDECIEYDIVDSCPLEFDYDKDAVQAPVTSPTVAAASGGSSRQTTTVAAAVGILLLLVSGSL